MYGQQPHASDGPVTAESSTNLHNIRDHMLCKISYKGQAIFFSLSFQPQSIRSAGLIPRCLPNSTQTTPVLSSTASKTSSSTRYVIMDTFLETSAYCLRLNLPQRPVPEIHNDQVLIKVVKTGICGSDVHYLQHGRIGSFVLEEPMCLGHESAGVVVKLGPNVREDLGVKVGTRVAMEPGVCCRSCANCKAGLYEVSLDLSKAFRKRP